MKISLSLPSFPKSSFFFFISLIAYHLSPCFGDDAHGEFKACSSVYYNCGELVNITYPFWGNERPGFCGREEFELKCKDNKTTTIVIKSMEFYVLNISQSDHRMTIARSDLFDSYCPRNQIETATLDQNLFMYSTNDVNLSVWYDCPSLQRALQDYTFWCDSVGESNGRLNYALEPEAKSLSSHIKECRVNIEVTITRKVLEEGIKNKTTLVEKALREGFEVDYGDWHRVACDGCKEYGGTCAANSTHEFYCICGRGDEHPYVCARPGKSQIRRKIIIGAIVSVSTMLIISIIIIYIYFTIKRTSNNDNIEEIIIRYSIQTPKRYSYSKMKKMTDSFKYKLGQGGFSTVYKGKLPDGRDVAVKLLNESRGNAQDFINEVVSISKTSHVNVATLLGFCSERNKRALIYEYMPKGSLDKYISRNGPHRNNVELDWNTLYNIVLGVARGLEYLHRGCNTRILHFDIKPHNILLDNEFCPKISDFGLAKQCKARESHVSMTGVKGTAGFIAPEVIFRNFGRVSHKSDVYSYGMLVLEMVGERKNPNEGVGESSEEYFPDWIYKDLTQCEIDGGWWWGNTEKEEEMARKMMIVGLHCIQTLPDERPPMSDVVAMLEGSVDGLQIPPKPNLFGRVLFDSSKKLNNSNLYDLMASCKAFNGKNFGFTFCSTSLIC